LLGACTFCHTAPVSESGLVCCCDFFYLSNARRADVIKRSLERDSSGRTKNDSELIVTLKIRHLLDSDFRKTLQDVVNVRFDETDSKVRKQRGMIINQGFILAPIAAILNKNNSYTIINQGEKSFSAVVVTL
jgi:hypothetical protein